MIGEFFRKADGKSSMRQASFKRITQHTRVYEIGTRRGGDCVRKRGLARLRQPCGDGGLTTMQGACEFVRNILGKRRTRKHEAP